MDSFGFIGNLSVKVMFEWEGGGGMGGGRDRVSFMIELEV